MPDVRLIDANALLDFISDERKEAADNKNHEKMRGNDYEMHFWSGALAQARWIRQHIKEAPTISAVPVAHGRWVRANDEQAYFDVEYVCSGCQFVVAVSGIGTPILYGYKFCPHCGLPMDAKDMDVPTKDGGAANGNK